MRVSLRTSFGYPTRDPGFGAKWFWGTGLLFLGLFTGGLLLLPWVGYFVVTARAVADGEDDFLPEWSNYLRLTGLGLAYLLVGTVAWFVGAFTAFAPFYLLEQMGVNALAYLMRLPGPLWLWILPLAAAIQTLVIVAWIEPGIKLRKSALLDLPVVGLIILGLHFLF